MYVLGNQLVNPSIRHMEVPISHQFNWKPLVTPFVQGRTNTLHVSTYPMWYNVIPPYIHLYLNLYLTYTIKVEGFDPLISRNDTCYIPGYVPILNNM